MRVHLAASIVLIITSYLVNSQVLNNQSSTTPLPAYSDCNGEVTDPGTIITSNGYPDNYSSSLDCWLSIRFPEGETIQLRFLDFDVNGELDRFGTGCSTVGSYLELLDGFVSLGKPYCSYNTPTLSYPISSTSNTLTIHFKYKHVREEASGRGYKVVVEYAPKCYCQHLNGDSSHNGIVCGSDGAYVKTDSCISDSWCTGPHNESRSVPASSKHEMLCEVATVFCGEGALAPRCELCPRNNDTVLNGWCTGHCHYVDETNTCEELFTKLPEGQQTNMSYQNIGIEASIRIWVVCQSKGYPYEILALYKAIIGCKCATRLHPQCPYNVIVQCWDLKRSNLNILFSNFISNELSSYLL